MNISENKFALIFHIRKTMKFNRLYLIFRYIFLFSPLLIFIWFLFHSIWILFSIGLLSFIFWMLSVKMKSLRNINFYAAEEFRNRNIEEMRKIFR